MPETRSPLPAFHFVVEWGGMHASFSEVTGLNDEAQVIDYRDGTEPAATRKMPGLEKSGTITLKRGVFSVDSEFPDWLNAFELNRIERRDLTIRLLDEERETVMVWKVHQAWPTKITAPDLKASGNETAIETLELAHEGVTIENP